MRVRTKLTAMRSSRDALESLSLSLSLLIADGKAATKMTARRVRTSTVQSVERDMGKISGPTNPSRKIWNKLIQSEINDGRSISASLSRFRVIDAQNKLVPENGALVRINQTIHTSRCVRRAAK